MNSEIKMEITALGGDITQQEWQWLIKNGPHGKDFTWGQTKSEPAGYVGVEHLEKIVAEKSSTDPTFINQARRVVEMALKSGNTNILIRAIQISAVVGSEKDLTTLSGLTNHPDDLVQKNAKASLFYLKKRLKSLIN